MKNILLLIYDDEGQEARLQAALCVARAVHGHITCLNLTVIPEFAGDYAPLGGTGLLLFGEDAVEAEHGRRLRGRMEGEDVPFDWMERAGFISQTLEAQTRLVDLIVMSTDDALKPSTHMNRVIGDLLVNTGKPVLAVPPGLRNLDIRGDVMIAWDGSEDAEAALSSAVPLLKLARSATIFYVNDGSLATSAEEAARYLSRHGVRSKVKTEEIGFDRAGEWLICEAENQEHDYIVMGAFGHSRTLEAVFGGVTHKMLKECEVPMLMVHRR